MAYIDNKLGAGEKVIYFTHQHPFVLIRSAGRWFFLFLVSLVVLIVALIFLQDPNSPNSTLQNLTSQNSTLNIVKNILMIFCGIGMFVSVIAILIKYLVFINEEYIVTNERVIKITGVFSKSDIDSSLSKINNLKTAQSLFGRMFNYGTIQIDTGNDAGVNQLDYIDKPFQFKKCILDAKNGIYGDASDVAPPPKPGGYIRSEDGERRYQQPQQPQPQAYNGPPPINHADIPALLQELARLRDGGVITPEEFQDKKNDLLKRL